MFQIKRWPKYFGNYRINVRTIPRQITEVKTIGIDILQLFVASFSKMFLVVSLATQMLLYHAH